MNQQRQGFDDSARRQADFSSLITVVQLDPETASPSDVTFDNRGILFQLPTTVDGSSPAVLLIVNEKLLKVKNGTVKSEYVVKPIANSEYDREMSKAYRKPLKRQAWRLFQNNATGFDIMSEIIPREVLGTGESWKYRIRYIRRPAPIILEDLGDDVSIDGISDKTECELNPILHMDILLKAVELAYASRGGRAVPEARAQQEQQ